MDIIELNTMEVAIYIHQWEFTAFLLNRPEVMVKDMKTITGELAIYNGVSRCDCCDKKWEPEEIVIKILT